MRDPDYFDEGLIHGLTRLRMDLLAKETLDSFECVPEETVRATDDHDLQIAIGSGEKECPLCKGKLVRDNRKRGRETGVLATFPAHCDCNRWRFHTQHWKNPASVQKRYHDCTYEALMSGRLRNRLHRLSDEMYWTILAVLQAYPDRNILMYGATGYGKTTLSMALMDKSLNELVERSFDRNNAPILTTPAVWSLHARTLADEYLAYISRSKDEKASPVAKPTVTVKDIQNAVAAGLRPCLLLDEFDKWTHTEFQNKTFSELINECDGQHGRLVVAMSGTLAQFYSTMPTAIAEPMVRRLADEGIVIDFQNRRVHVHRTVHVLLWQPAEDSKPAGWVLKRRQKNILTFGEVTGPPKNWPEPGPFNWSTFPAEPWATEDGATSTTHGLEEDTDSPPVIIDEPKGTQAAFPRFPKWSPKTSPKPAPTESRINIRRNPPPSKVTPGRGNTKGKSH